MADTEQTTQTSDPEAAVPAADPVPAEPTPTPEPPAPVRSRALLAFVHHELSMAAGEVRELPHHVHERFAALGLVTKD